MEKTAKSGTVTRTPGNKDTKIVVNQINIRAPYRSTQDIEKWRTGIRSFENIINPSRLILYDLFEDVSLDGQIESTWGKRVDWILNKPLVFIDKTKNQDEDINKLLNCPDMRFVIKHLLDSILWGYTLIQVNNIYWDDMEERWIIDNDLIPRKHVHPERNFKCISRDQNMPTPDFLYQEDPLKKYMVWAGEAEDKGLLVKAAQYVIYKRGDFGDWSQFAEMFGMPFREASYEDYDEATRIKLEDAMEKWGGANYMIRPKGAELKIHDTGGNSGSNSIYKDLLAACNAEISKIILGNTLTTEQGDKGAKSLGTVHEDAEKQKHMNDEKYVLDILNSKFRAILKTFGIDVTGGAILFMDDEADWDKLKTKWEVYAGISAKVPVDDDTIYEEFNIPKPKDYDKLKEEMKQNSLKAVATAFNQTVNDGKTPPQNILHAIKNFFV